MTNTDDLIVALQKHLIAFKADTPISAEWLASSALKDLDPEDEAPTLVSFGCNLQLRQMARDLLRKTYDPIAAESPQSEMFEKLQDRYPGFGRNKGKYIPRHLMTLEDRQGNIDRMTREVKAKLEHRDALQAETDELIKAGAFSEADDNRH